MARYLQEQRKQFHADTSSQLGRNELIVEQNANFQSCVLQQVWACIDEFVCDSLTLKALASRSVLSQAKASASEMLGSSEPLSCRSWQRCSREATICNKIPKVATHAPARTTHPHQAAHRTRWRCKKLCSTEVVPTSRLYSCLWSFLRAPRFLEHHDHTCPRPLEQKALSVVNSASSS